MTIPKRYKRRKRGQGEKAYSAPPSNKAILDKRVGKTTNME